MRTLSELLSEWLEGKKRASSYTQEIYLTRKDKRIADRQFKRPPGEGRPSDG
jgi:site-specific recombinase XerC